MSDGNMLGGIFSHIVVRYHVRVFFSTQQDGDIFLKFRTTPFLAYFQRNFWPEIRGGGRTEGL